MRSRSRDDRLEGFGLRRAAMAGSCVLTSPGSVRAITGQRGDARAVVGNPVDDAVAGGAKLFGGHCGRL